MKFIECPWCGSHLWPEANTNVKTKRLNPWQCIVCGGMGSYEDFDLIGQFSFALPEKQKR